MSTEKEKEDLKWQHPEDSDSLQKSEKPNREYMEDNKLCQKCHGILNDRGQCTRGCK